MNNAIYFPASTPIGAYATSIWEVKNVHGVSETILPKGSMEIIFNFSQSVKSQIPSQTAALQAPRCFIQGMLTAPLQVSYAHDQHLLGICIQPDRLQSLLGILPSELINTRVDLTMMDPRFDRLWHQLQELTAFEQKIQLLEQTLPSLDPEACARKQRLSQLFLSHETRPFQSVDELARAVCYSTRQLNRVSHSIFGLPAEALIIYKKFMQAVHLIHHEPASLTSIAYGSGFYDQAHLCRTFKSFTGMTAKQYKNQKSKLPFHIFS
jgi:AraC-like DNA-binding protein